MASTISGTNSPPLEATGEHKPMGKASVDGGEVHAVSDSEQRKEYFESSSKQDTAAKKTAKPQKMGQSLADKIEKVT